MAVLVPVANGTDEISAENLNQLIELFQGLRNIPVSLAGINDAANYALTIKNAGAGSKAAVIYAADGTTVLFQADSNGVLVSSAGGAASAVATQTGTETLSNKTLDFSTGGLLRINRGVLASRPAAASAGRMYFATDAGAAGLIFMDTGSTWILIGPADYQRAASAGLSLSATVYATAASITLGAGRWIIWGGLCMSNGSAGAVTMEGRITDGTTVWSSTGATVAATSSASLNLPPNVVTPGSSTTYNLQGYSSGATGSVLASSPAAGQPNASAIVALRIG